MRVRCSVCLTLAQWKGLLKRSSPKAFLYGRLKRSSPLAMNQPPRQLADVGELEDTAPSSANCRVGWPIASTLASKSKWGRRKGLLRSTSLQSMTSIASWACSAPVRQASTSWSRNAKQTPTMSRQSVLNTISRYVVVKAVLSVCFSRGWGREFSAPTQAHLEDRWSPERLS